MTSAIAVPISPLQPNTPARSLAHAPALALRDTRGTVAGSASRLSTQAPCQAAGVARGVLRLYEREALALDADRLQALAQAQLAAIDLRIARLHVLRKHVAAVSEGDRSAIDDPECHLPLDLLDGSATALHANIAANAKAHSAAAAHAPQSATPSTLRKNRTTPKE